MVISVVENKFAQAVLIRVRGKWKKILFAVFTYSSSFFRYGVYQDDK
jgi:hypothetical protein